MKAITIAYKEDGTTEMLAGPEVLATDQRAKVRAYRDELPEGVSRIECRVLDGAKISIAARPEPTAEPEAETPKAPKAPKAPKPAKAGKDPKKPKAAADPELTPEQLEAEAQLAAKAAGANPPAPSEEDPLG
jgi:hypothetical protein